MTHLRQRRSHFLFARAPMRETLPFWDLPPAWEPARQAAREGGTLLVLGGSDLGKSTLAAILASAAVEAGRATAVVDSDVGQSSFGPPACVSLARVRKPLGSLSELTPEALDFVGATSPVGHLLGFLSSVEAMVDAARLGGAETVVVDTTGLIAGPIARALKGQKIRRLDPDALVALQAEEEIEHLLAPYRARSRPRVLRLRPSRSARPRSREQRAEHRRRAFATYFAEGRVVGLDWKRLPMENTAWTTGEVLTGPLRAHVETALGCKLRYAERSSEGLFVIISDPADRAGVRELQESYGPATRVVEAGLLENLLVGLLGERGETQSLGIITGLDFRAARLEVLTPCAAPEQVRALRLGSLQLGRDGRQLGWLEAGELG